MSAKFDDESHIPRISELAEQLDPDDLHVFFETATDLFCVFNPTHLVRVNKAWSTALGWSSDELTGRPWADFLHPDDRQPMIEMMGTVMKSWEPMSFDNRWRTKAGRYIAISWSASPHFKTGRTYAVGRISST